MSPIIHTEKTMFCHQPTMCPHGDAPPSVRVCGSEWQVHVLPIPHPAAPLGVARRARSTGGDGASKMPQKNSSSEAQASSAPCSLPWGSALRIGTTAVPSSAASVLLWLRQAGRGTRLRVDFHPAAGGLWGSLTVEGCGGRRGSQLWRAASRGKHRGL